MLQGSVIEDLIQLYSRPNSTYTLLASKVDASVASAKLEFQEENNQQFGRDQSRNSPEDAGINFVIEIAVFTLLSV